MPLNKRKGEPLRTAPPMRLSKNKHAHCTTHQRKHKLTEREQRLLTALMARSVTREQADSIAGASNSPHVIMMLRKKGYAITCERIKKIDRDGKPCRPGLYTLTVEP